MHSRRRRLPDRAAFSQLADPKAGASLCPLSRLDCTVFQPHSMSGDRCWFSRSGEKPKPIVGYVTMSYVWLAKSLTLTVAAM
jgi:hypothetical protein